LSNINTKKISFKGAVTEILTPFARDGSLDIKLLQEEIEYQLEEGIRGLFVNGLASEGLLIELEDRVKVAEITVRSVKEKIPIMANIAYNSIQEALELLKRYEDVNVDAIAITQPMVYPYSQDSLYSFFAKLASATKLPVYIYNAPQSSNVLSPHLLSRLFKEIPNIKGYKDSTQDIIHLQNFISLLEKDHQYEILAGSDATILPTLQLGGAGVISLISTVFPRPIIEICDAYFNGDIEKAKELQFKILRIRNILKIGPFMAGYKYAAALIGHPMGMVKEPLVDLNEQERAMIKEGLAKEGLLK
jgi:4-hydroxy-tetrahydrodipicolinate synthase